MATLRWFEKRKANRNGTPGFCGKGDTVSSYAAYEGIPGSWELVGLFGSNVFGILSRGQKSFRHVGNFD
ncbi:MAG: hypothetical protein WCR47_10110, partial [Desulfoplanes sp.]